MKKIKIGEFLIKNEKLIKILLVVGLYFVILVPYLVNIFQALPTSDDFCMTVEGPSVFIGSLNRTGYKYLTWSGEFIYFFLQYFMNPIEYVAFDSYLFGTLLCAYFILYICAFRYLNVEILKCVFKFKNGFKIELMSIFVMSVLLFADNYHEIFFWYTGMSYAVEYAFLYFAVGAMFKYFDDNGGMKRHYIMLIIFGMLCCNAVNMCVPTAVSYFVIAVWNLNRNKESIDNSDVIKNMSLKFERKTIIPLIFYILMGCVTVFAPGNFVRKSEIGDCPLYIAFARAFTNSIKRVFNLCENPTVFFMFLCLFVAGVIYNSLSRKDVKKLWVMIPVLVVILYGILLPVAVGYGYSAILVNRVCFLLDAVSVPMLSFLFFWFGMVLADVLEIVFTNKNYLFIVTMLVCCFYGFVIKDEAFRQCEYINEVTNIKKVKAERALWAEIYNEIYFAEGADVTVDIEDGRYVSSGVIENPGLDESPEFWINQELRRYFKKNSISVNLNEWE